MRFFEFELTERRMADLYHNSNHGDKILSSGKINVSMPDKDIMDEPTEQERKIGPRISLTRDFHYDWAPHKFVIDQAKLASRQKIIPIDTLNPILDEPRAESEEYVLKPIPLDMIKAVILPNITDDEYENNHKVAKMALDRGIQVFVGKHPKKLTPITKDDISDAPPEDAVAVITDPGLTPFAQGEYLTQTELDSAYDEYEDDFEFDMLESIEEGPQDFADMKLDGNKLQQSLDYFYTDHAPNKIGGRKEAGSLKGHNVVTFTKGSDTLMFLVDKDDRAVFYVAYSDLKDGVAVGNVRSNGTVRATEVYAYLVDKFGTLYSDSKQTPQGRKIWSDLAKFFPDIEVTDVGDRLRATKESIEENFADGKVKGKSRPGRFKKAGVSCKGSVSRLRKKAKNSSGEKQKGYHFCANMKSGRKKGK